jgi:hypothetical protein
VNVSLCSKFQDLLCCKIDAGRNDSKYDRSMIVHVSFHHVPHKLDVRLGSHALSGALEDPWDVDDTEMLLSRAGDF